jgi:hypothetical protein
MMIIYPFVHFGLISAGLFSCLFPYNTCGTVLGLCHIMTCPIDSTAIVRITNKKYSKHPNSHKVPEDSNQHCLSMYNTWNFRRLHACMVLAVV